MSKSNLLGQRYQMEESLGSGGMAVVYRARDLMLERDVAIKVLKKKYSRHQDFRNQFRQEAKSAANLSHPNIVTVHDFGLDDENLYIVMEYVPGEDLKRLIINHGPLKINEAIPLIVQACEGVGYAHRAGLVHCDIKPQNMLVTEDQRLKVVDFGIARALASIHPEEKSELVWGSPQYFSPEQAVGSAPSPASDVYSIGVVLYEMLTGKLPFQAESSSELARLHREREPIPPSHHNPSIPPPVDRILLKVLSKEPAARYRTADQLGRVLTKFAKSTELASEAQETLAITAAAKRNHSEEAFQATPSTLEPNPLDIDWFTIILGLLALIAVGGLVPFYLWVYFRLNPAMP
jgi:serine/threonine-protein kinase